MTTEVDDLVQYFNLRERKEIIYLHEVVHYQLLDEPLARMTESEIKAQHWGNQTADTPDPASSRSPILRTSKNGPRDVSGLTMTHCVPNERVATAGEEDMVGA